MSTVSGSCVCKAVNVTVKGEPDKTVVCYCEDCRKMSGNLSHIIGVFDTENVQIDDPNGKLKEYHIKNTASGKPNVCLFCGDCATMVASKPMVYEGKNTLVRTTILDNYEVFKPSDAIFKDERVNWHDSLHKL